ncbi:MAG: hypothetical protein JW751_00025 [Polyangiaceae bacterium]|nr:hypothetical protein [Polyangiaceae bacterium]
MKILLITSCTGEKAVDHPQALTMEDFRQGPEHVRQRERELADVLMPARDLYTGQQHVRLMRGVRAFEEAHPTNGAGPTLELQILSAGYGLVPDEQELAPYEATFNGMKAKELRAWADALSVPEGIRAILAQPFDLCLLLLGDGYLKACALGEDVRLGGPTIAFCGSRSAKALPDLPGIVAVPLTNQDAKRFRCPLISLKGELAARLLEAGAEQSLAAASRPADELVDWLDNRGDARSASAEASSASLEKVDFVIQIPQSWHDRTHRSHMRYFIPEWDDLVDPDFDFANDEHSGGKGNWSNQVYAHQMFAEPNYDGILVSKVVAEHGKEKRARINELGVHRFLRVPRAFPVMGDCGAFGYIKEEVPPYTTDEILDYYTRLDFDYGVSIDHLIVKATAEDAQFRYDLTLNNAEEFLREHKARGLRWTPIGAVQGWDARTYASGVRRCVQMGYRYIGLGGLVRTSTKALLPILAAVRDELPAGVDLHLFGLGRLGALPEFKRLGVTSVDSASYLRQAWLRTKSGYVMPDRHYSPLRIPEAGHPDPAQDTVAGKRFRAKVLDAHPHIEESDIFQRERAALASVRAYASRKASLDSALNDLLHYDQLITSDAIDMEPLYRRTLEERPWERCPCEICRSAGVEVVIFRGNNRNRRRGFHNTYVFYRLLSAIVSGQSEEDARTAEVQLQLFDWEEGASAV